MRHSGPFDNVSDEFFMIEFRFFSLVFVGNRLSKERKQKKEVCVFKA